MPPLTVNTERARWWALVVVVGVLLLAWKGLSRPQLLLDDSVLFMRSFQAFAIEDWFATHSGYRCLLPSLVASILCTLPTAWIPIAFAMAAVSFSTAVFLEITATRWRRAAPRSVRLLVAVGLAWLPLGNYALSTLLSFSQWQLLFWAFLVLHRAAPASTTAAIGRCVFIGLLAWSHPLALALVPIAGWRALRERGRSCWAHTTFIAAALAYLAVGCEDGTSWHLVAGAKTLLPHLLDRVVFETWFGTATKQWLIGVGPWWLPMALGAGVVLFTAWIVRRAWRLWPEPAQTLVLSAGVSAVTIVAAALVLRGPVAGHEEWGHRYLVVARLLTVLVTVLGVGTAFGRRSAALMLLATFAVTSPGNRTYYRVSRVSVEFRSFLAELESQEHSLGSRSSIQAELDREEWPIRIDRTPR